jgi:very-short-patch-repair endonuclease
MSPTERIKQLLQQQPGLKAQQIANELGMERSNVAAALHQLTGGEFVQDSAYRWWPKRGGVREYSVPAAGSFLGRLCRYYLECLTRESGSGISIPAAAQGTDYAELDALPFVQHGLTAPGSDRGIKKILRKVRQERGQIALYIGYAVRLRLVRIGEQSEMRIEPVLLYPVDEAADDRFDTLQPASGIPLFNLEVLKSLLTVDSGNVIDEAIHLSDELGLADPEDDLPPWDEVILRLQHRRPDWDWRESLNPHELSQGPSLAELRSQGIYNRAVLFAAGRSPFTYGLETELRKLAQLDEAAVRESALGVWLRGESVAAEPAEDHPILELLPLNTEQRQAVVQGLSAPLTVVTGPPGTGKSQVVISLLANMAWQGGSVLFASRNNHAVDVVETRANELGPFPWLLRVGKEEHHARLAQVLTASLADTTSPDDPAAYAWLVRAYEEGRARFAAVQQEIASVVGIRNEVDERERASEAARGLFEKERFAAMRSLDLAGMRRRLDSLAVALDSAREGSQAAIGRLLQTRRSRRLAEAGRELRGDALQLGIEPPALEEEVFEAWEEFHRAVAVRVELAGRAQAYWQSFDKLRAARPLEELAGDLTRIADESAQNSAELWRRWLRLWPSRWEPEQRKLLSEYVSLLQMIASGDRYDEGSGRKVFRRYYSLFPKVTRLLPCWAVTSLSARGRLPFEPAFFDLVVIDEASQCDIASALPLLFRAKRAVIIGDPLQLKHVSTVAPQEDRLILSAHGLAEGRAAWAYSVNSLFDLARSLCRHEDIVNLRDHHRSHREIIGFSNRHFYRGALRIATDHEALKRPPHRGPAVRWLDVRGKVMRPPRGGAVNTIEAQAVVERVGQLIVQEGYTGSIGVVTPFRAQANRIRTLAQQSPAIAGRLAALQFVVDTVHGFQGDERDVMFFSPVVSAGINESTLRFLKNHGNLFNVAITRARSELVVIGDRQAALGSGVSYLAGFAEYAGGLRSHEAIVPAVAGLGPEYPVVARPELVSQWERIFYQAMYAAGLRPVPQYEEAPYTLDFALFDGQRKLDIEIDGEHYHRNWDGELCRRDQIRSRRLRDLGWDIMRFWVYELRDDLAGAIARVKSW